MISAAGKPKGERLAVLGTASTPKRPAAQLLHALVEAIDAELQARAPGRLRPRPAPAYLAAFLVWFSLAVASAAGRCLAITCLYVIPMYVLYIEFERIAADHPVFRIEPIPGGRR